MSQYYLEEKCMFAVREACLKTNGGCIIRHRFSIKCYLCARSISFLLRLSPNGCTKEHIDSPFTQICPWLALDPILLSHNTTVLLQHTSRCFSSLGYVSTNTPKPVKLSIFPNTGPVKEQEGRVLTIYKNVFLMR